MNCQFHSLEEGSVPRGNLVCLSVDLLQLLEIRVLKNIFCILVFFILVKKWIYTTYQ